MSKVLLVTDYSGNLHITPVGNKTYYQQRNQIVKEKVYNFKEMEEDAANEFVAKNNGIDPDYTIPAKAAQQLDDKNKELDALREQLKRYQDAEILKLREETARLSTTPTSNSEYSKAAAESIPDPAFAAGTGAAAQHTAINPSNSAPAVNDAAAIARKAASDAANDQSGDGEKAIDLISKINSALTADEVNALVTKDETRKTVVAARDKKLEDLKR